MGIERRRAGFRLSWTATDKGSEDESQPGAGAAPNDGAAAAVETLTADAPAGDRPTGETPAPESPAPESPSAQASMAAKPAAETPAAETTPQETQMAADADAAPDSPASGQAGAADGPDGDSNEFLVSLVSAMRGVAETSRDASLAELRTTVEAHIEQLNATAAEQEADLRRAADLDLQGVGDWERDEAERIKSEAEARREARRTRLDQQLADHRTASEREVEATRARLSDHERDLAAFFAQLGEISDPAAFVAAAKRMPQAPDLSSPSATPTAAAPDSAAKVAPAADDPRLAAMGMSTEAGTTEAETADPPTAEADATQPADTAPAAPEGAAEAADASTDNHLAERLAQLDQRIAGETQPVAAAAPPASNGGETSTAVIVKGLGSFGAITSFKQALERVEGVRGVTLSLGPTGEFVYRASHAADFDMVAAVQSVEGPSATVEDTDGTLVVTLSRAR
jgi:hypothetical protein